MRPLTIFLGKLLGLFTLITSFWLLVDRQETVSMLPVLIGDRRVMIIFAIMSLGAGLAMVLGHNVWSGGLLPVLVSLIGWLLLIRGVIFLFLSSQQILGFLDVLQFGRLFYIYLAIPFLLGLFVTYLAFTARPRPAMLV